MAFLYPIHQFTYVTGPGKITYGNDQKINIPTGRLLGGVIKNGINLIVIIDDNNEVSQIQVVETLSGLSTLKAIPVLSESGSGSRLTQGAGTTFYANPNAVINVINYTDKSNVSVFGEIQLAIGARKVRIRTSLTGTQAITLLAS